MDFDPVLDKLHYTAISDASDILDVVLNDWYKRAIAVTSGNNASKVDAFKTFWDEETQGFSLQEIIIDKNTVPNGYVPRIPQIQIKVLVKKIGFVTDRDLEEKLHIVFSEFERVSDRSAIVRFYAPAFGKNSKHYFYRVIKSEGRWCFKSELPGSRLHWTW